MPRSCWRYLGTMLWTLPKWGLQYSAFVQRPLSTGPDERRVSWGRMCGEACDSCRIVLGAGAGWQSLGIHKPYSPQGPRGSG